MPRQFYWIRSPLSRFGQSGNAIIALQNPQASGRRLNIHNIYISNYTITGASSPTISSLVLGRVSSSSGGFEVPGYRLDTASATGTVAFKVFGGRAVSPSSVVSTHCIYKNLGSATTFSHASPLSKMGTAWRRSRSSSLEKIVLHANESLAAWCSQDSTLGKIFNQSVPLMVEVEVLVATTPAQLYKYVFFTGAEAGADNALVVLENGSSGVDVTVRSIEIHEVGTFDTPYYQIVPIGQIDAQGLADTARDITSFVSKMDSNSSNFSSYGFKVLSDVPILPFGVPVEYISQGSAGTPKGFNYLNTKDFIGPLWRAHLCEQNLANIGPAVAGPFGPSMYRSMFGNKTVITLRENEGLALVSAAESATGTASVGLAGWQVIDYTILVSVENLYAPELVLTGLKANSEVRVYNAGTQTALAGVENSGTSFTWQYDYTTYSSVDIVIHNVDYEYLRIEGVSIGTGGVTIPVQQRKDRQYANA